MTTDTVLTDAQIFDCFDGQSAEIVMNFDADELYPVGRAIEQAVLQSLTDADRIEAAARMLSKCLDYPWEFMTSQGHDSMREYARATINAAMEKQP